jgi:hypothetical protein
MQVFMENLRKYFETLPVVHIIEDNLNSELSDSLSKICAKYVKLPLSKALSGDVLNKVSLAVIEFSTTKQESITTILSKINALEIILACDDYKDIRVLDRALSLHLFGVINRVPDIQELGRKLKSVIMSISTKQKERVKTDYLTKIVEAPGTYHCIKRGGQIIFANQNMYANLGVATIAELNSIGSDSSSIVNAILSTPGNDERVFTNSKTKSSYMLTCREFGNECIFSYQKASSQTIRHNSALSHVEFIEALKDTLISRNVNDEGLFAVTLKLENAEKIITDYGNEFFYVFFDKFSTFCGLFFDSVPVVFWSHDYLVMLANDSDLDIVREKADELFHQSSQYKFDEGVVPFIGMSILDLAQLSISEVISLIDNLHKNTLNKTQVNKLIIKRSSTTSSAADGKMAMYHIQNIASKDNDVKLSNIYKGMSIGGSSQIEKIENGDIYVKIEKMQKYLMNVEKAVTIQSKHLPKEIYAEVVHIDKVEPFAILRNPIFLEFSVNSRKNTRVQCDARIPITVNCGKIVFTGEIFDLSVQAIAIKYTNKVNNDILHSQARLSFSLPKTTGGGTAQLSVIATVNAIKYFDDHAKIITSIKLEPANEGVLLEYIYARQKELIIELKKLGSLVFS